jgi:hypothetical protein
MHYEVSGPVKLWSDDDAWHFFLLPADASAEIYDVSNQLRRGFNSVRVDARIGATAWRTSVFWSAKEQRFMLPLKKAVRQAHNISVGDTIMVSIELVDF